MERFDHHGQPIELIVFGNIDSDRLVIECWDMAVDGGLIFNIWRRPDTQLLMLEPFAKTISLDLIDRVKAFAADELP